MSAKISRMLLGEIFLVVFVFGVSSARTYDKCSLAQRLLDLEVPIADIPTYVCIAKTMSGFDPQMHSGDTWGLFGVSGKYWCNKSKVPHTTNPLCQSILDSLPRAVALAMTVKEVHGFAGWGGICKNIDESYLKECDKYLIVEKILKKYCKSTH